jgi:hypothetical protein
MITFPMYEGRRELAIVQLAEILCPSYSATYGNQAFPHPSYGATRGNPPNNGFYKGKHNFISQEKFFSLLSLGI